MSESDSGGVRTGGVGHPGLHLPHGAKPHTLEYCVNNGEFGATEAADILRGEFPDLAVKAWRCLGHCHYCAHAPFVVIDDDLIEGEHLKDVLIAARCILNRRHRRLLRGRPVR